MAPSSHWLELKIPIIGIAMLGGCAPHFHALKTGSPSSPLAGEFHHGPPSRLVLQFAERRYVAENFTVNRHSNWSELQRAYGG